MTEESSVEHSPPLKDMKVTPLSIGFTLFAIVTYFADIYLDIDVAYQHFNDGSMWYFALTVIFITVPAVIMAGYSLKHYLDDCKKIDYSIIQWIMRALLILFLAPVLRYFDALYYAFKSWKSNKSNMKQYYARMYNYESNDAAFLRLLEGYMESGPQLILQIYILASSQSLKPNQLSGTEITQLKSIVTSVISMSSSIVTYGRSLRISLDNKKELPIKSSILPWLWRLFELSSRVIALGLFASVFPKIFWVVCMLRFMIMTTWIRFMKTDFCDNKCAECFYNLTLGLIFIFCYFNPKDTPTRNRMVVFYFFTFMENTLLLLLWYLHYPSFVCFKLPALVFQVLSFVLSIGLMVHYYYFLHPTVGKFSKESTSKHDSANDINADISENDNVLKENGVYENQRV